MASLEINGDDTIADAYFNGEQIDNIYYRDSGGDTLVWERPEVPGAISDFNASDDQSYSSGGYTSKITFTWTNPSTGTLPITYDIYKDGNLFRSNKTSGYYWTGDTDACTSHIYKARSTNAYGYTDSNTNAGMGVIDYSTPLNVVFAAGGSGELLITAYDDPIDGCPAHTSIHLYKNGAYYRTATNLTLPISFASIPSGTYSFKMACSGTYDTSPSSDSSNITIT